MEKGRKSSVSWRLASGLLTVAITHNALGAPPLTRAAVSTLTRTETSGPRSSAPGGELMKSNFKAQAAQLDLRPPADLRATGSGASAASPANEERYLPFPSMRRGVSDGAADESAAAGAARAQALESEGRIQQLAHRFQHEGMGAHLWENHSALVSLGLNQRGKPGLWLIQKVK
jgi:hypothetical protein